MVKYSPKENSYREMYLINKFEKDVMENNLRNSRNNKKDLIDKSVTTNNENLEGRKEAMENNDKKYCNHSHPIQLMKAMKLILRIILKYQIYQLKMKCL